MTKKASLGLALTIAWMAPAAPFAQAQGTNAGARQPVALVAPGSGRTAAAIAFHRDVAPILEDYCYDCHGDGMAKGKVAFDDLSDSDLTSRTDLWFAALKNLRANIMPPAGRPRPSPAEASKIADWIKYSAFGIDPADPDPGRVTIRRLNRVEYNQTIRALLGVEYPSEAEFPPDDTGNGFDNIGDVLSTSPLLIEKYLQAAETVITSVVPQSSRVTPVATVTGREFRDYDKPQEFDLDNEGADIQARAAMGRPLRYDETVTVSHGFGAPRDAKYHVDFDLMIKGPFDFDVSRCRLVIRIDGQQRFDEALAWSNNKSLHYSCDEDWRAGAHEVSLSVSPLAPATLTPGEYKPAPREKPQHPEVRIVSVQVKGPFDPDSRVEPPGYRRFFPRGEPPALGFMRSRYAREILGDFAGRAFRRPVDAATLDRLVQLARGVEKAPGGTFELGVSRAMMAVLASPRFIFHVESGEFADAGKRFPRIDEYSLASRLSYFLWSSMPDAELFALARTGQLRAHLREQVERMLRDPQSEALVRNFTGQWLQARDVETVPINAREVLGLGPEVPGVPGPKADFDDKTRKAMRRETEMVFDYVVRGDRSVLELVDGNYTFLNEKLAEIYGIPGVKGASMRMVALPKDSLRGGVLTEGTVLTVTSNPTRTSPVKRGQFVLENILGTPTPPPPPNIPALEASKSAFTDHDPTLKEMLARHRADKLCSSCHGRMDPIGLAFENFNALGNYRDRDAGQPIETAGRLVSGEGFSDVRDLKRLITHERRTDYYRCLTEKLLTYALGRGLEYYDAETVDRIVGALERDDGRFSTLLMGVIESAPFQRQRVYSASHLLAQVSADPRLAAAP